VALGDLLTEKQARGIASAIGVSMVAFGALPLFDLERPDAAAASMMRSLGVRDTLMGVGLWSAASHGGKYLPWLLTRALTDGGDTLAVGVAVAQGKRDPRFIALGGLALGAALTEVALYAIARSGRSSE
jgi:hypothetical protein